MQLRQRFGLGVIGASVALALCGGGTLAQQGPPPGGCPPPGGPMAVFGGPPPPGGPPGGAPPGGPPPGGPPDGGPPPGGPAPGGQGPGVFVAIAPTGGGPPSENDLRAGQAMMQAAFDLLAISPDQMRSQAQAGHSLGDIAGARGIDLNTLVQTMTGAASTWLSGEVAAGHLAQSDADAIVQRTQQAALQIVTMAPPAGGPPGGGPPPGCPSPPGGPPGGAFPPPGGSLR
ncbi:MAG TPA: hypothetical protein VII06_21510 [Chloroflexota bacterium]